MSKEAKVWARLPNAAHIDRVLAHVKAHPDKWRAACSATTDEDYFAAYDAAKISAWSTAKGTARGADRNVAYDAVYVATWDAAWGEAWGAAWGACMALVAWDDCAYILDLPPDAVKTLVNADDDAAMLLYPAVRAMQGEANE